MHKPATHVSKFFFLVPVCFHSTEIKKMAPSAMTCNTEKRGCIARRRLWNWFRIESQSNESDFSNLSPDALLQLIGDASVMRKFWWLESSNFCHNEKSHMLPSFLWPPEFRSSQACSNHFLKYRHKWPPPKYRVFQAERKRLRRCTCLI